ncbi:MAG TPA: hypothetical protein VM822_00965, partial [Pseudolabrys sp.]|nr:hypothetical protein [Pseudolabrys sp.]
GLINAAAIAGGSWFDKPQRARLPASGAGMTKRYLEDFAVGQVFKSGRKRVAKDEIFAFARQIRSAAVSSR